MPRFDADADLHVAVTLTLSEAEARALMALSKHATPNLGDDNRGLETLLKAAGEQIPTLLERAKRARDAWAGKAVPQVVYIDKRPSLYDGMSDEYA